MSDDPESGAKRPARDAPTPETRAPLSDPPAPDMDMLVEIARMRMPFGRYAGTRLIDLPEPYVVWFRNRGFPRGRLGQLLSTLYEVKANGLEAMLAPLREPDDPRRRPVPVPVVGDRSTPMGSTGDRAPDRRRDGRDRE